MEDLKVFTDDILVRLYADGNNEAFDVLLERYQNRIYSYIQNIVKDRDLANDLFQETFVKAIVTIKEGRYTETGKFNCWLTR
ncbi:MAG: sigma factor, partial [Candidatus Limisoma sp.]|nr:sigma factor [Candidatus Limisoma sp.]